jgi:hypothetical protein
MDAHHLDFAWPRGRCLICGNALPRAEYLGLLGRQFGRSHYAVWFSSLLRRKKSFAIIFHGVTEMGESISLAKWSHARLHPAPEQQVQMSPLGRSRIMKAKAIG